MTFKMEENIANLLIKLCYSLPLDITLFEKEGLCRKPNESCIYCCQQGNDNTDYLCKKKTYTLSSEPCLN